MEAGYLGRKRTIARRHGSEPTGTLGSRSEGHMQVEDRTCLSVLGYRGGRLFTPAVLVLCILHIAGFVAPVVAPQETRIWLVQALGLLPDAGLARLHLWQLVTHTFLYPTACFAWLLVGALTVFVFFASRLEREWGTRRFAVFYVAMAAAAGLVRAIPEFGGSAVLVGSLGVICAVLAAYGVAFRGERVWLWVSSVPAQHFVLGLLVVLLLLNLQPVANVLWLSGAAFGLAYTRAWFRWERRHVRRPGAGADRFSQIDLGD